MNLPDWPDLVQELDVSGSVRVVASMLVEDPDAEERLSRFWVKPEDACMITFKFCSELAGAVHKFTGEIVHIQIDQMPSIN